MASFGLADSHSFNDCRAASVREIERGAQRRVVTGKDVPYKAFSRIERELPEEVSSGPSDEVEFAPNSILRRSQQAIRFDRRIVAADAGGDKKGPCGPCEAIVHSR